MFSLLFFFSSRFYYRAGIAWGIESRLVVKLTVKAVERWRQVCADDDGECVQMVMQKVCRS